MPNYSYACDGCGTCWDQRESVNTRDAVICPDCKRLARRTYSAPGIAFKGAGFYTTDKGNK